MLIHLFPRSAWEHNAPSAPRTMERVSKFQSGTRPQSGDARVPTQSVGTRFVFALLILFIGTVNSALAQRNLKDIPDPDPELERKTFTVPDGFEVNLYAGDPQIAKPIQMSFDAEGKLWIASSETYPHIKPGEKARDKILVLEDTDQDGKVDKSTVFADDLLIPTGILPGDGGCYVVNSTELLHLKDTNADGKADQRRVVLSGFGTEDTHHLLHSLRWGVDGSIYMNQSIYIHSHVETPHGVKRLNGGGIWRFRPETMRLEIFCRGFVNPWGHHQDRFGQSFATDGAYGEGINYVFPGAIYVTAPGEKRRLKGLNPGSPKHCGLEITSGTHLPEAWRGNMITNDFRAHRVCRFIISEDGSGYSSRQAEELIKSTHVAFRPIDVKMGPDGAIYIADWYNPIIQHGEVDFRDPRRDHVHGRIWRFTAKDRPLVKRRKIVGASIRELLDMQLAEEDWVRLWAKQELKTRDHGKVYEELAKWIETTSKDWQFFDGVMLELAWLDQTLGSKYEGPPQALVESAVHNVRAAGVRITSNWADPENPPLAVFANAVRDEHAQVRLEGVRALAQVPTAEAAEIAAEVLDQPMDRFLDFALWQAMRDLKPHWLPALEQGKIDFGGNVEHLTFALRAVESPALVRLLLQQIEQQDLSPQRAETMASLVGNLGTPAELSKMLSAISKADAQPATKAAWVSALASASSQRNVRPAQADVLSQMLAGEDEVLRVAAIGAMGVWKHDEHKVPVLVLAKGGNGQEVPRNVQLAAIDAVSHFEGRAIDQALAKLSAESDVAEIRIAATAALGRTNFNNGVGRIVQLLTELKAGDDPTPALEVYLSRKEGPGALAAALAGREIPTDVAKVALRAASASPLDTAQLQAAIRKAGGISSEPKKYTADEIAVLVADVKAKGDPHRGEAIYRRKELQCLNCHAIGGAGGLVGPDLISIGASAQVDYLVESLVDPNAKVKENFHSIIVETDKGKVISGIPVRRTDDTLVLRDNKDQEVTLPIASIDNEREGRSLMPEGLVDSLTRDELIDLTRFMSELGKEGEFAVGKQRVVRRYKKLIYTDEGHRRLNRTSHDTAAGDDPALTWEPAYSRVDGTLPVDDSLHPFVIHRGHPPVSFVRFELNVTSAGEVGIEFGETTGLALWVDGKPTELSPSLSLPLQQGQHKLTISIDRNQRKSPMKIALPEVAESTARVEIVSGK